MNALEPKQFLLVLLVVLVVVGAALQAVPKESEGPLASLSEMPEKYKEIDVSRFREQLQEAYKKQRSPATDAILIVLGAAVLALGIYLYKIAIFIPSFLVGAFSGYVLMAEWDILIQAGVALLFGVAAVILAFFLERVLVFLHGAILGAFLSGEIYAAVQGQETPWYVYAIAGAIVGLLALKLFRYIVVIVTAMIGAVMICLGTGRLLQPRWTAAAIMVLGAGVQFVLMFRKKLEIGVGRKVEEAEVEVEDE